MMLESSRLVAIIFICKGNSTFSSTYLLVHCRPCLLLLFFGLYYDLLFVFIYLRYVLYSPQTIFYNPDLALLLTYVLLIMMLPINYITPNSSSVTVNLLHPSTNHQWQNGVRTLSWDATND